MAVHGKFSDALFAIGEFEMGGKSNEATLALSVPELDTTSLVDAAVRRMPGVTTADLSLTAIFDAALSDAGLFDRIGASVGDSTVLSFGASRVEGAIALLGRSVTVSYGFGARHGDLLTIPCSARMVKRVIHGYVGEPGVTTRSTSSNGAGFVIPAVGATQKLYAALHFFEGDFNGTVVIETDDAGGFGTPTTRITFDALAGVAMSDWQEVAGAITDTYARVKWTRTSGSGKFIVTFGIA